jgi:hypothetical protein
MFATLKNRMNRVLVIAALPVCFGAVLAGSSLAKLAPCVNFVEGTCNAMHLNTVAEDDGPGLGGGYSTVAEDDGPGLGGGYSPADSGSETALDDGPGLGGGYAACQPVTFINSDGPGGSTPYIID